MGHIQIAKVVKAKRSKVFECLTNPEQWTVLLAENFQVQVEPPIVPVQKGAQYDLWLIRFSFRQKFRVAIEDFVKDSRVKYRQIEGIGRSWIHETALEDQSSDKTLVTDTVNFELPFGLLGHLASDLFFKTLVKKILLERLDAIEKVLSPSAEVHPPAGASAQI